MSQSASICHNLSHLKGRESSQLESCSAALQLLDADTLTNAEHVKVKAFIDTLIHQLIREAVKPYMPRELQIPAIITLEITKCISLNLLLGLDRHA